MSKLTSLLDRNAEDIVRPPNLPEGVYIWQVSKLPEVVERAGGKYEILSVQAKCVEADEDTIDPDLLDEFGPVSGETNSVEFFFSFDDEDPKAERNREATAARFKEFISHCGIDPEGSMKILMSELPNTRFRGLIKHQRDGENTYVRIHRTMPEE